MFVKKFAWLLFVVLVLAAVLLGVSVRTHADGSPADWFAPVTPSVTKVHDYPADGHPFTSNLDCNEQIINTQRRCTIDTNIGTITTSGGLVEGASETSLKGYGGFGWLIPVPNSSMFLDTRPGAINGQYIAVHRTLERKDIALQEGWGWPPQKWYETTKPYDLMLTDSNANKLQINTQALAFSRNGYWMVFDVYKVGLFKMNMATMDIFPAGPSAEGSLDSSIANASVAISDDGRYVAMGQGARLIISDTSTCLQQAYAGGAVNLQGCRYRDIWAGQHASTGKGSYMGIRSRINNGSVFGNLRFVDDGNLRFDARYDYESSADYKVAEYVVTASGARTQRLGLLGMGDSYISGQGEYDYVPGTYDPSLNMCHLSPKSYPYVLGAEFFDEYHSVACSGATTKDITNKSPHYMGQALDHVEQDNRDANGILRLFSPGYIYQNAFTQTYQPAAVVLSIGGNNVGFSDILKSCIADISNNSTCYATREERQEILNSINDAFYTLADTYNDIQNASPATRIYVVGYPQIIKPGGSCGDNVRLKASETEFANQLTSRLDAVIARAAAKAGVFYVDTEHAFDGFRLCEAKPGAAAMNGLTVFKNESVGLFGVKLVADESYHPTVLGHQLLANVIAGQTQNLTAPMPDPQPQLGGPLLDSNDPFLTDVPETGQNVFERVADDSMISADYIIKGAATKLNLNGLVDNLAGNAVFDIVLHSTPVNLGQVTSDANGNIATTITLPQGIPAGMHTLHVYGKDFAGQPIDVQKVVYVVNPDGPAYNGYCQVVPDSRKDVDEDGIDDACDPVIGEAPAKPVSVTQPDDSSNLMPGAPPMGNTAPSSSQPAEVTWVVQPATIATVASYRPTTPFSEDALATTSLPQAEATKPQVLGTSIKVPEKISRTKFPRHRWLLWEAVAVIIGLSGLYLVVRARTHG